MAAPALLIWVGVLGGLTVWILAGRYIGRWWRNSITVRCLRWQLADIRAALAYPFRLVRKWSPSTSMTAGEPSAAPAVIESPTKDTP